MVSLVQSNLDCLKDPSDRYVRRVAGRGCHATLSRLNCASPNETSPDIRPSKAVPAENDCLRSVGAHVI